ncbi:capsule biosynthesis protein [Pasteurellaceae bacterium LIM206]|nr:capsule biosynthesis protein [Pasteurellaceae bacterium LIM206]
MVHYLSELLQSAERILLLQGPIGTFFREFSHWLTRRQKTVFKLNFNGGDEFFYPQTLANTVAYRDDLAHFPAFLTQFCQQHHIQAIVCFGDNRSYHKIAKQLAEQQGMSFWVFEEGYFRPDYITFEKWGVNDYSPLPRDAEFYKTLKNNTALSEPPIPQKVAMGFCPLAKIATKYYCAANWRKSKYPNYAHHRILSLGYYIKLWVVSGIKRLGYWFQDSRFARKVEQGKFGEFFIVPLQVYDDTQVRVHSDFASVGAFLAKVLESFARFAPAHCNLIVKHHPMDRGFIDYSDVIAACIRRYPALKGRVFYIHDVPMPVFLRHGKGIVTLNSTSGISALLHGMPTITLGRANYDIKGLTYQGNLNDFWCNPTAPDPDLFRAYRLFHLNKTHINGNFYNRVILP